MNQMDQSKSFHTPFSNFQRFQSSFIPREGSNPTELWFIFFQNKILLKISGNPAVPTNTDFEGQTTDFRNKQFIGELDGLPCYCMETGSEEAPGEAMSFTAVRSLAASLDSELFRVAGLAYHILHWSQLNAFCGRCGAPMQDKKDERAKICPQCGSVVYPRISPAIITAVVKGDQILLAHNNAFANNLYSLVAGFVEPGETLEDAVKREVFEEIGIQVKNPQYVGSQPWPFPDSLMLAFVAEYESGEIHVDGVEIGDAKWFSREELPFYPGVESIAGRLIRWFREEKQENL